MAKGKMDKKAEKTEAVANVGGALIASSADGPGIQKDKPKRAPAARKKPGFKGSVEARVLFILN